MVRGGIYKIGTYQYLKSLTFLSVVLHGRKKNHNHISHYQNGPTVNRRKLIMHKIDPDKHRECVYPSELDLLEK